VHAFTFDPERGTISDGRVLVTVAEEVGGPDGLTVDADGDLWVAIFGGGRVRRYSPDGELREELRVPAVECTSCAFAGAGLNRLYVTTATENWTDEQRRADRGMDPRDDSEGRPSRTAALAARLTVAREHAERLPGASIVRDAFEQERELGGGLIAGGVAFRVFLWLVPFGLVVAALLSFWSEHDPEGLEEASREFGVGAAAAEAGAEALQGGDRNALIALLFGLVLLAWFTRSC
jgi:SMP-30/Gluconolactonase/LRE-like region